MKKLTQQEFISKAIETHGNLYDYSKTIYKNRRTKIDIICKKHGTFSQNPYHHTNGSGCPKCKNEKLSKLKTKTKKDFVNEANKIHNFFYDYSKSAFTNRQEKTIITCPIHGDFKQSPKVHLTGCGCTSCSPSGFDISKPALLYYLSINDGQAYKIGITNRTLNERFSLAELQSIKVLQTWNYEKGIDCLQEEQKLLKLYQEYKYHGPDLLSSGNTELFYTDIFNLT